MPILDSKPNQQITHTCPKIEPVLLQFAIWKQEAGQPITPNEGVQLENSLIDGKPLQDELKAWQVSHHLKKLNRVYVH